MGLEKLDNLVKINQLKKEPPDQNEFDGMLSSAKRRLQDAQVEGLSEDSQFCFSIWCCPFISPGCNALAWISFR